ncbi:MAG: hypothetical protein QOF72_2947 [Blastocatellia bacterium]|jgi:dTDP-4-amino-4,6-dideoxygalactose transaminase|nr:hypothetical protein [Blastocatellia bacterium]
MLTIPQCDPRANYLSYKDEIDHAIASVLESGRYILGRELSAFEEEFGAYIGVPYAIGVANGTDALHLALRACGIGRGDFVITVSHTAVATVAAIELAGAIPVLVDIDSRSFTLDPKSLEQAIQRLPLERIKAIVPVHIYGHPSDLSAILAIAKKYGLIVVEDCAQSHGAVLEGNRTGSIGHLAAFSFYPTKNLGGIGDGGMVVTGDREMADRVRLLREYGWRERYISYSWGTNSRLDEMQAAILRVKLKYLEQNNHRRQSIAERYNSNLAATGLNLPQTSRGATHVYHQYVVRTENRNDLKDFLAARGVGTLIHYPVPVHKQPAYVSTLSAVIALEQTEAISAQILSLPIYPELTNAQIDKVCEDINVWSKH